MSPCLTPMVGALLLITILCFEVQTLEDFHFASLNTPASESEGRFDFTLAEYSWTFYCSYFAN